MFDFKQHYELSNIQKEQSSKHLHARAVKQAVISSQADLSKALILRAYKIRLTWPSVSSVDCSTASAALRA